MRNKRKGSKWKYAARAAGFLVGCGLLLYGLVIAGIVELSDTAFPSKWMSGSHSAPAVISSPASQAQDKPKEQQSTQAPAAPAGAALKSLGQAQSPVNPGDTIAPWMKAIQEVRMDGGARFSVNDWVKQVLKTQKIEINEQDLSHLSSLLYEAAMRAGLESGERYLHKELPTYANPGFDVAYEPDRKDLTLFNPWDFPVQAEVLSTGAVPIVQWSGIPSPKWSAPVLEITKEIFAPDRIVLVDYLLTGGGEVKRQEGKDGMLVKVYKSGNEKDPKVLLYKDFYAPLQSEFGRPPSADEQKTASR